VYFGDLELWWHFYFFVFRVDSKFKVLNRLVAHCYWLIAIGSWLLKFKVQGSKLSVQSSKFGSMIKFRNGMKKGNIV
jgi:hypothetical protein